eukprot:643236-Pelagomonas_calceolata.AAC.2
MGMELDWGTCRPVLGTKEQSRACSRASTFYPPRLRGPLAPPRAHAAGLALNRRMRWQKLRGSGSNSSRSSSRNSCNPDCQTGNSRSNTGPSSTAHHEVSGTAYTSVTNSVRPGFGATQDRQALLTMRSPTAWCLVPGQHRFGRPGEVPMKTTLPSSSQGSVFPYTANPYELTSMHALYPCISDQAKVRKQSPCTASCTHVAYRPACLLLPPLATTSTTSQAQHSVIHHKSPGHLGASLTVVGTSLPQTSVAPWPATTMPSPSTQPSPSAFSHSSQTIRSPRCLTACDTAVFQA